MKTLAKKMAFCLPFFIAAVGIAEWDAETLCSIDPHCRPLLPEEKDIARPYFGDHVDYETVRVFSRKFLWVLGEKNRPMSVNGHIYLPGPAFTQDGDNALLNRPHILIHEMAHVWQVQSMNKSMLAQAASEIAGHGFQYHRVYKYTLNEGKPFLSYNFEQQAKMLDTLYTMREELKTRGHAFPGLRPPLCRDIRALETKISEALPQQPTLGCYQ